MKIDLTCPVELWQYAMPTDNDAECTFVLNNLSSKVVISVQVALSCYDRDDELLFRQSERVQGLKAGVGERFSIVILPSEWQGVEGVDLVIEKVWFDDATIWRKGNAPLVHYVPNALPAGRALDELRFVAGQDAMGYPQAQEQVWLCVCGRANAHDSDRCCRCERRRDAVFASFNRENVAHVVAAHESKLAEAARKAREDNNLLQENQEKQRAAQRRKRKKRIRMSVALIVLAAAAAATVVWGLPELRYHTALDLLTDGHFEQARAAFGEIPDWRDSQMQVLECDYQQAQAWLKAGDADSLMLAQTAFETLEAYRDSAECAKQAAYQRGVLYLNEKKYDEGAAIFESLGDYQDSQTQLQETLWQKANELFASGSFEEARTLYIGLNGYADSTAQIDACTYQLGLAEMEEENYEAAIGILSALGSYEDAEKLVKKAYYAMAEAALLAENYEQAGDWYLLAGDYGDAQAKANDCLYRLAQSIKAAGDYEKARELFLRIPEYLDSLGQADTCVYALAKDLMEAKEYAAAAEKLSTITSYDDSQSLLDECRYQLALAALDGGDAVQAETLLAEITGHKEARTQLRKVRYQLAEADQEAGLYEAALERFALLEDYSDAKTRVKQCRYALAQAALTAAEYDSAIEGFSQLGSYKDSEDMLEEAQYQRAMAFKASGDRDAAAIALNQMEGSKRASEALTAMTLEDGAALEAEQKYAEALALYESMPKNKDAQERAKACRYAMAQQQRDNGDLFGAAEAFHALGTYQDASVQMDACYAAYYGGAAQAARDAMKQKDYLTVVGLLHSYELDALSKAYRDLEELFNEACYQQAEKLYRDGKPYEAMPFYQRVGDYRDTADEKLSRRAYLVLGEWESSTGKQAVFRTDGTCDLMGEALHFRVSNFSLYTGPDAENMSLTHKLSSIDEKGMSLRDIRNGQDVVYKFTRAGDFILPQLALPVGETADE